MEREEYMRRANEVLEARYALRRCESGKSYRDRKKHYERLLKKARRDGICV